MVLTTDNPVLLIEDDEHHSGLIPRTILIAFIDQQTQIQPLAVAENSITPSDWHCRKRGA